VGDWCVLLVFRLRSSFDKDAGLQAVTEILTQSAGANGLFRVAVGRRNKSHVYRHLPCRAYSANAAFLDDPQQFGLGFGRHPCNFVQKQCTALGRPEEPQNQRPRRFDDSKLQSIVLSNCSVASLELLALHDSLQP